MHLLVSVLHVHDRAADSVPEPLQTSNTLPYSLIHDALVRDTPVSSYILCAYVTRSHVQLRNLDASFSQRSGSSVFQHRTGSEASSCIRLFSMIIVNEELTLSLSSPFRRVCVRWES